MFFKISKKVAKHLGYFCKKNCRLDLLKWSNVVILMRYSTSLKIARQKIAKFLDGITLLTCAKIWDKGGQRKDEVLVVVKWSACLPSNPLIRVRIPLKPTVFSVKFEFEKNKNIQKEARVGPLKMKGWGLSLTL